jgi:hypothetical protein
MRDSTVNEELSISLETRDRRVEKERTPLRSLYILTRPMQSICESAGLVIGHLLLSALISLPGQTKLDDDVTVRTNGECEIMYEMSKSNQIKCVTYAWLADVNVSVAKCMCF